MHPQDRSTSLADLLDAPLAAGGAYGDPVLVGPLTRAEIVLAVRRLAALRPHIAAAASLVDADDLWRLCRDELTGEDVAREGWDIRARWFGVVVAATPRLGALPRSQTIPWRIAARHIAADDHGVPGPT